MFICTYAYVRTYIQAVAQGLDPPLIHTYVCTYICSYVCIVTLQAIITVCRATYTVFVPIHTLKTVKKHETYTVFQVPSQSNFLSIYVRMLSEPV